MPGQGLILLPDQAVGRSRTCIIAEHLQTAGALFFCDEKLDALHIIGMPSRGFDCLAHHSFRSLAKNSVYTDLEQQSAYQP